MTKNKKQLIMLGVLLAAIVVVLIAFVFKPQAEVEVAPYVPAAVDTRIPRDLVERPEYRRLRLPVELPLTPGLMGRTNPFEPY